MEHKKVVTKPSLEEDKVHGTREFPVQVYREGYAQYPMGIMDIHWHRYLELDIVIKGRAKIQEGDREYILNRGEGIFVNSNVLHKSRAMGNPRETEQISVLLLQSFLHLWRAIFIRKRFSPFLDRTE